MPTQINSNYSANFQKFVDFANKARGTKGENTVARFAGMPTGDYKGAFASFWRTADMKAANDQVRDLFRKTVADMFGGEKFIPDFVRDNMKLEDFGKGKPLTARRINLVKIAIDTLGGGKFTGGASVERAKSMGYAPAELSKLARTANLYQQATGCTDEEAENAALDTNSKARVLFDCGGRFTLNAENFKKGLALMDKFPAWFSNLHDDHAAGKLDTPTKLNFAASYCLRGAEKAALKFVFDEIATNPNLSLDAEDPEEVFGMANNPAMRFVGREYTTSFSNSLAQMSPKRRSVLYAVVDALDKIALNAGQLAQRKEISQSALLAARVIKNFDAVVALQAAGKLDRANLVPLLYPDLGLAPNAGNVEINDAYDEKMIENPNIIVQAHAIAVHTGASMDDVVDACLNGKKLDNLPEILHFSGNLQELDGTATGGRNTMLGDIHRPSAPLLLDGNKPAIADENLKFVFNFPDGTTLAAATGAADSQKVKDANNAIADKLEELCGRVHPKQLSNVYYALSQSSIGGNTKSGLEKYGIKSDEHIPVTFTLSRNAETGAVTIRYSEPKGLPIKFNWTTTIDVDGNAVTTPIRIDHGQYEAEAMKSAESIAFLMPGKDNAAAGQLVKDMLAYCGDDFDLKDIVSGGFRAVCITSGNKLRSADQIKAIIDAIRANLEEVRREAAGNAAVEKAGIFLLQGIGGKSIPPGLIGKIVKAAASETPGEFAKLSANATPQQIIKAVTDLRKGIETVIYNAKVKDAFEGGDQMMATRDFVTMLLLAKLSTAQLQKVNDAFRSETASKLITVLGDFEDKEFPAGVKVREGLSGSISAQSSALGQLATQYNFNVEVMLGKKGGAVMSFDDPFDKTAFGAKDIFNTVSGLAELDVKAYEEKQRRDENVRDGFKAAKPKAGEAYSKAGEGNAAKVDKLIYAALTRCAESADAIKVVVDNINEILLTSASELRSIEEVRERAESIAADFK